MNSFEMGRFFLLFLSINVESGDGQVGVKWSFSNIDINEARE